MKINVPLTNERGRRLHEAKRIATTYGISVEGEGIQVDGEVEVCSAEACFIQDGPDEPVGIIFWTGSYPFANDHDMGSMPTWPEAVRYAIWLLKREAFYQERDEAIAYEASECIRLTPGCRHKDYPHDECETY